MDKNGLVTVFLLLVPILANFSDASSNSNYRKLAMDEKVSLPGSTVQSENKKSDEKSVNESNTEKQFDQNEPSKENKLNSETETQTSKEDKKVVPKELNQTDNDKESDKKIVEEGSKQTKLGSQENLDPGSENKPNNVEKPEPKPVDVPKKEESELGKKQSDPNEKPGSEPVKDENKEKKQDTKPGSDVPVVKPATPVPKESQDDKGAAKKEDKIEKKEEKSDTGTLTSESCDGSSLSCRIQEDFFGCIKIPDDGSKVVVIVQNKGESNLTANVATDNTGKGLEYEIPKKQSKMISVPVTSGKTSSITILSTGGKCNLPLHQPLSEEENYLFRLPTYDKLITPVNGAYFLILSAVIFGGTFSCIKLSRRRRQGSGIPYQELEMGIPESVSVADVETAEGWDEGWDDDDWENDSAVKSTAAMRHSGSISANGLTSRATNKDGWDDNWDD